MGSATAGPRRHLPVLPVASARPEPPLRGGSVLAALELPFLWADRALEAVLPAAWNPLAQTGAIANAAFLIAAVSGGLLLFWYSPSVHHAHASLEALRSQFLGQLMRSLHRYSSDVCMLFVVLHALRLTFAQRIGGARWLAWVTGVFLVGALWVVGWLGYWLVWDDAARQVALGTAAGLDVLPIFTEPLSRSFLTDEGINPLLFFVVFFLHMLLPLGMGIALWLHITRLQRPRYLPSVGGWAVLSAALVALSVAFPAVSGAPARMAHAPAPFSADFYYLLPLGITDRASGWTLWAIFLGLGVALFAAPWVLSRARARPAEVVPKRCNECNTCVVDCPYDAIRLEARPPPVGKYARVAVVDPAKCVGCGICAGSCDSAGIGTPELSQIDARNRMVDWIKGLLARPSAEPVHVAFACAHSAAAGLAVDVATGEAAALPGYRVVPVACIGWVHPVTVERALREGAAGVLLVGCGPTEPACREGVAMTGERLSGARKPGLRTAHAPADRVRFLRLGRTAEAELLREAERFRRGAPESPRRGPARAVQALAGVLTLLGFSGLTLAGSRLPYRPPHAGPELFVSFKHAGRESDVCRAVSAEEKAKLPKHMQQDKICERGRAPVRLQVLVDGQPLVDARYEARGVRRDGVAVGLERLPLAPGPHRVRVRIGDTPDPEAWAHETEREIEVRDGRRAVVLFDRQAGYRWYAPED